MDLKLLVLLIFSTPSFAGLPPPTLKGQSDASRSTKFNLEVPFQQATSLGGVSSLIETGNKNLLSNPGFEGASSLGWSASGGSFSRTTTAAQVGMGVGAGSFDASSASQTLSTSSYSVPEGFKGQNGIASCQMKCASSTCTHTLQAYDGTNVLSSTTITSSTTSFPRTSANFVFPSSGSVSLRLVSVASDEPTLFVDDCYLGLAEGVNLLETSSAQLVGSAYFSPTGSCTWSRGNTSIGAFSTTSACPGPTIEVNNGPGTIQTTDSNLPRVTVNNLPPGEYLVFMTASTAASSGWPDSALAISDGTTTSGTTGCSGSSSGYAGCNVVGHFRYTSAGNRSFELYGSASANTLQINNTGNNQSLTFRLLRLPSVSEQAYRADQLPASWSGYHDNTCSFARTNTAYGDPAVDATCTLTERSNRNFGTVSSYLSGSDKLPGITFTPARAGRFLVCATPKFQGGSVGSTLDLELSDTSSSVVAEAQQSTFVASNTQSVALCGIYQASDTSSKTLRVRVKASSGSITISGGSTNASAVEWTLTSLDQAFPHPAFVGSVSTASSGSEVINRAYISGSGSCTVNSQTGSWISSVSRTVTPACQLTITGAFSATPHCVCSTFNGSSTSGLSCSIYTASSSTLEIRVKEEGVGFQDRDFSILCMGAR